MGLRLKIYGAIGTLLLDNIVGDIEVNSHVHLNISIQSKIDEGNFLFAKKMDFFWNGWPNK